MKPASRNDWLIHSEYPWVNVLSQGVTSFERRPKCGPSSVFKWYEYASLHSLSISAVRTNILFITLISRRINAAVWLIRLPEHNGHIRFISTVNQCWYYTDSLPVLAIVQFITSCNQFSSLPFREGSVSVAQEWVYRTRKSWSVTVLRSILLTKFWNQIKIEKNGKDTITSEQSLWHI